MHSNEPTAPALDQNKIKRTVKAFCKRKLAIRGTNEKPLPPRSINRPLVILIYTEARVLSRQRDERKTIIESNMCISYS